MMNISMCYFLLPEIAALAIIDVTPYVVITLRRDIRGIGRRVPSVARILTPRCMCIMARMNIILKYWKTLQSINPRDVQNVRESSVLVKMGTQCREGSISVNNALIIIGRLWRNFLSERTSDNRGDHIQYEMSLCDNVL
jgi:hypothetical protein